MTWFRTGMADGSKISLDLLKDTVGFTGKNQAFSQTNNAVIAHIENGKAYKVSWTGSATVTLKKDSSSGTQVATGSTSPLTFTADSAFDLYFGSSADVTSIMVYDASISDESFEDYHDSVETMFEEGIYGVNLFKLDVAKSKIANGNSVTWSGNVATYLTMTFTLDESTGKITANGTPSGDGSFSFNFRNNDTKITLPVGNYKLSGGTGGGDDKYHLSGNFTRASDGANVKTINADDGEIEFEYKDTYSGMGVFIWVKGGYTFNNVVFNPMITKADIDSSYHPYNPQSIQHQLNAQTGVLGAKNLWNNTSVTSVINAITFTVNDNKSVTLNGTPSADVYLNCFSDNAQKLTEVGSYKVHSGKNASENAYVFARVRNAANTAWSYYGDTDGNGASFNIASGEYAQLLIFAKSGAAISNVTLYPMITLASDPDDTYVPFALTNRELTEVVNPISYLPWTDFRSTADANALDSKFQIVAADTWSNTPSSATTNGTLIVIPRKNGTLNAIQIYCCTALLATDGGVFFRSKSSSGTYSSWAKLSVTAVS